MTKRTLKITINVELDDQEGWGGGYGPISASDLLDIVMGWPNGGLHYDKHTSLRSHDAIHYTVTKPICGRWDKNRGAIMQNPSNGFAENF